MSKNIDYQHSTRSTHIYIVSDGIGESAKKMVTSALTQFKGNKYSIKVWPNVLTPDATVKILNKAKKNSAVIFYTMVKSSLRKIMQAEGRKQGILSIDLMGPLLIAFHNVFQCKPSETISLARELEKERIRRMRAVDFTLEHDDGKNPQGLKNADIILVGVSRASKSSTAFYLSYCGLKTANVPIHHDRELPVELLKVDKKKIVALTVTPNRLFAVRESTAEHHGLPINDPYVDRREIGKELNNVRRLIDRYNWNYVEVSYKAVEEVAWEVGKKAGKTVTLFQL